MRFLCLHGMGTNSRIFEAQTASIRYAIGQGHTYAFVDGAVPAEMSPTIAPFISPSDEFLQYVNASSPQSCMKAVSDLATYVSEEGPFDGVMAFSQGAGLAAVLLVQQMQHDPRLAASSPLFRCAIFFCGAVPEDPRSLQGSHPRRLLRWESDGELIMIPTVHVWGANDMLYPDFGPVLSRLCTASHRDDLVHDGGHEIPGAKNPLVVERVARLIKRCIARAETVIET